MSHQVKTERRTEIAVLAGGCFWGVEDILRDVPGVIDTEVGYTGGSLENPRLRIVSRVGPRGGDERGPLPSDR